MAFVGAVLPLWIVLAGVDIGRPAIWTFLFVLVANAVEGKIEINSVLINVVEIAIDLYFDGWFTYAPYRGKGIHWLDTSVKCENAERLLEDENTYRFFTFNESITLRLHT